MEDYELPVIDCTGCLAPCCKGYMLVEVDPDELNEHISVRPTVPNPEVYYLKHKDDGTCIHLTKDNRCGIYEHRPLECREFDCRDDERFNRENRGPNWVGEQGA